MTSETPVLEVDDLHKTFHVGFFRKKVEAVRGVSFAVREGETFGVLGPNGAGKTTTLKACLRLIYPSKGSIRIFGLSPDVRESMKKIGYLPENPYVYQYLKPLEFLDLCGRLYGLDAASRKKRSQEIVERVGLAHATDRPIGRFSKGMMQRIGLAQALLHDPAVLVLDEPMSGLDPIGRRQVRELILEERRRGKTIVFTSHILTDVEMLCDRVVMIHRGKVTAQGKIEELVRPEVRRVEIELARASGELREGLEKLGASTREVEGHLVVRVEGTSGVNGVLEAAIAAGAEVVAVTPERETLEEIFVRHALATS